MNKKIMRSLILVVFLIVAYFLTSISISKDLHKHQHRIFSSVDALEVLTQYITEEIEEDICLSELIPIEKFTYKVEWNNNNYNVYGYVFEDNLQCMQYVKNRNMPYYNNENLHLSSNVFFSSKYIVYSNDKLLYIEGPGIRSLLEFLNYIGQGFNITLG